MGARSVDDIKRAESLLRSAIENAKQPMLNVYHHHYHVTSNIASCHVTGTWEQPTYCMRWRTGKWDRGRGERSWSFGIIIVPTTSRRSEHRHIIYGAWSISICDWLNPNRKHAFIWPRVDINIDCHQIFLPIIFHHRHHHHCSHHYYCRPLRPLPPRCPLRLMRTLSLQVILIMFFLHRCWIISRTFFLHLQYFGVNMNIIIQKRDILVIFNHWLIILGIRLNK